MTNDTVVPTDELERLVRDALSEHEDGCSWGFTPPSPCPVCDKQALAEIRLYALAPALAAEVLALRKYHRAERALREAIRNPKGKNVTQLSLDYTIAEDALAALEVPDDE